MAERVLLADDHTVVREGLASLLRAEGFEVVGAAADGREAVRLAMDHKPDIAVLDLVMPEMNGLEAARGVIRVSPDTKVIILTMHAEQPYAVEALRSGARGYVLKTQAAAHLVMAIREIARGAFYLSPGIPRGGVDDFLSGKDPGRDPLSPREREILGLIAEGMTAKAMAASLGISARTVEAHRARIMEKLGIRDTAGLVRYSIRRGLVVP